jgi:septum formation protein
MNWFPDYNYILASGSPRRQMLLKALGIDFDIRVREINENFPAGMPKEKIPVYLAELKAGQFLSELTENDLLITADTIVWLNGRILGKPENIEDARQMLLELSGEKHEVVTGVCITSLHKQKSFFAVSGVNFKILSGKEIDYYISKYKPFDKAGAYGIQEWIGYIGITHIEGSFYNVMGLPVQKLYTEIMNF